MKRFPVCLSLLVIMTLSVFATVDAAAQNEGQDMRVNPPLDPSIKATFVHLGNGEPGVLYEPRNPGPKAQIAIFAMHSANDFLTHSVCQQLSIRGYRVLCANDANDKTGEFNNGILDKVLLQMKSAMLYLRKNPEIKKIVLWGHSGGATLMAAYQNIAENGVKACQDEHKFFPCPDTLAGLPPADGVIMGDANWGLPIITLLGIDPSVGNDTGLKRDADLDMFNPKNGFDANGSHYSPEFIRKYELAQAKRNNAILDLALERLAAIKSGKGAYGDNEPFIIAGASFTNHLIFGTDMSFFSRSQKPWPLLHPDGTTTTEIVHSLRVPELKQSPTLNMRGALKTTVLGYLSTYAIRADPEKYSYGAAMKLEGVDWTSSWSSPPGNAEGITVPFLTMGMTGSYETAMVECLHEHLKSADKTLVYVEGATHGYSPCTKCGRTPGQYGDTIKTIYDYADQWLSKPGRFL